MLPILCASLFTASIATVSPVHAALTATPPATRLRHDDSSGTAPYVVTFRAGSAPDSEAGEARSKGWRVRNVYRHAVSGMTVELSPDQVSALAADPNVATIEPDVMLHASVDQPGATWGLDRIDQRNLPLSGTYSYPSSAGAGVRVYVLDTGVRSTHAEIAGRVQPGFTLIEDGSGTEDCNGHGTHVAGTIAGTTYGVAKAATIVPVRVLDCLGSGSLSAVIAGLDWVLTSNKGAPAVVNMSLGGGGSFTVDTAVQRVINSGVPVVVAAGNSSADACASSPARVAGAITVGAIASDDSRATYSNFGSCLDLFAPGSGVTSAGIDSDTATAVKNGTSMATPHVAGAVAVLKGQQPSLTPAAIASALAASATAGLVADAGTGSPNLLLYSGAADAPPPPPAAAACRRSARCVRQVESVERRQRVVPIVGDPEVERVDERDQLRAVPRHDQQQHLRFHVDQPRQCALLHDHRAAVLTLLLLADPCRELGWFHAGERRHPLAVHHQVTLRA